MATPPLGVWSFEGVRRKERHLTIYGVYFPGRLLLLGTCCIGGWW